jgi:hypothetical protein
MRENASSNADADADADVKTSSLARRRLDR